MSDEAPQGASGPAVTRGAVASGAGAGDAGDLWRERLRAAEGARDWERAEEIARRAAAGGSAFWRLRLSAVLCRRGRTSEALAVADALLRERPGDAAALVARGAALLRARRWAGAEEALAAAWAGRPHPFGGVLLARVRQRSSGAEGALRTVDAALERFPQHPALLLERARLLRTLGRRTEEVEAARRAMEASPGAGAALATWLAARLAPLGPEEAVAELRRLLRLPRLAAEPRLHALLGRWLERAGQPAEALEAWRRSVALAPDDPGGRVAAAFALRRCGARGEAFPALQDLVRTDPAQPAWLSALVADARALGRQREARRLLRGLLRADPARVHLWGWLRRLGPPSAPPGARDGSGALPPGAAGRSGGRAPRRGAAAVHGPAGEGSPEGGAPGGLGPERGGGGR